MCSSDLKRKPRLIAAPDGIELIMVGPFDIKARLERVATTGKDGARILGRTNKGKHVTIAAAMKDEIIRIRHRNRTSS